MYNIHVHVYIHYTDVDFFHATLYVKVTLAGISTSSKLNGVAPTVVTLASTICFLLYPKEKWRCVQR